MAHFAQLDENNTVIRAIVVDNNELLDNGVESEEKGIAFCNSLINGRWIQTSYNGNIRKNYAGEGYIYDQSRDAFIPPQPFKSWILNENTCRWDAPVSIPDYDNFYVWDEETMSWIKEQK